MTTGSRTSRSRSTRKTATLAPDQTRVWVRTYGRHARIYAWGFFVVVLAMIFGLIWWELGEINNDLLASFGFAALVTFLLACWSRRITKQQWRGVIEEMFIKVMKRCGGEDTASYIAKVRTEKGRRVTLRLSEVLYDHFQVGDEVLKIAGLEWPEKMNAQGKQRVCLACGNLSARGAGACPRCGSPEPDHGALLRIVGAK